MFRVAEQQRDVRQGKARVAQVVFGEVAAGIFQQLAEVPALLLQAAAQGAAGEVQVGGDQFQCRFALQQAALHFPGRPIALFSDNQDAVGRLNRAREQGLSQDPALARMLHALGLADFPATASIRWIKGHGTCRGNTLADQHAAAAAR